MASEGIDQQLVKEIYSALIVDDTSVARYCEQKLLNNHGFTTMAVENGQEAINLFVAGKSFDVVIMDLQMPTMNGIQATKEIRAMGVKSLIFGVTATDNELEIQAFKAAGLNDCFEKPLNYMKIDKILKQLNKK